MFRAGYRVALLCACVFGLALSAALAGTAAADDQNGDIPFNFTVRVLATDSYQVEVDNTNPTKLIKSFDWAPPSGVTVIKITNTVGGTCTLDGNGGITCKGTLYPPNCQCAGGGMIVNFSAKGREPTFANGYWTHYGFVGGVTVTGSAPAKASAFGDLPVCGKGQKSTKAKPCAPA